MKTLSTIFLCVLISSIHESGAADTSYLQGLGDTRYHRVQSDNVGRDFHVYVMLPDTYEDSAGIDYPTIYLLDGGGLYPMMTAYYRYLNFGEEIPDAIIVGISYGGDTFEEGNFRSTDYTAAASDRDYWGGAEKFQSFIRDELFPIVEQGYRSDASRRIVFGQSIGGQFVLYTALTEPNLFWGHIASNPALHRNLPYFLERHDEPADSRETSRLFVADGTLNDSRFRDPAMEWITHWINVDDKPWILKTVDLDGHTHMSAPPASFRQGLRWLFSGD